MNGGLRPLHFFVCKAPPFFFRSLALFSALLLSLAPPPVLPRFWRVLPRVRVCLLMNVRVCLRVDLLSCMLVALL